ncbi:MAG: LPS export ABC transporter permease LptG [Gammaproteobacteria bacterium]
MILDRYIGMVLARSILLVALVLVPLFMLLDLLQQLDDVGVGNYGLSDALVYEVFMMPGYLLSLVPFIALLGSSIALGGLAHTKELTAMRACGISIARIGLATLRSGVLFMSVVIIIMEWIAPPLHQQALKRQSLALSGVDVLIEEYGFWIHKDNRFVNVRNIYQGNTPADIHVFEFDPENHQLNRYLHADRAETDNHKQWLYKDLIVKNYQQGSVETQHEAGLARESYLTEKQLQVLELPINSLPPSDLFQYLQYLRASGQITERFELVFWQKVTLPIIVVVMMLCSLPFVFGSMRVSSMGKRIVLATITGLSFQLISQLLANLGLMLNLSPLLMVLLPIAVILMVGAVSMRRTI